MDAMLKKLKEKLRTWAAIAVIVLLLAFFC